MRSKYKIVFLGNASVGKTTLISQYVHQQADGKYHPTIGIDFLSTKININGKSISLQLWDTAGQERFNSIIPNYTRDAFIAMVVFDVTKFETFDQIDHWINNLVRKTDPDGLVKIVLIGNKVDLIDDDNLLYDIDRLGQEKAKQYNGKYIKTNAMKYESIKELVDCIRESILDEMQSGVVDIDENRDVIVLSAQKNARTCC
ncbi:Ras-related protein Rab-6B [Astathelohania contejeani]|uniref:Ras-related protein Rab-6B n=1 Tax=Astathelohania contejeani TaxID=164912 RepID=A0ABQ7I114_9MICR|nr:Ras-related protein Rab-6B [Thelohania contejeani]